MLHEQDDNDSDFTPFVSALFLLKRVRCCSVCRILDVHKLPNAVGIARQQKPHIILLRLLYFVPLITFVSFTVVRRAFALPLPNTRKRYAIP